MSSDKPVIFISHRHSEHVFANVIAEFISERTARRVAGFTSSAPLPAGRPVGKSRTDELVDFLVRASVVLPVYGDTRADGLWSMWEMGVATNPKMAETQLVVFTTGDDDPPPLADGIRARVRGDKRNKRGLTAMAARTVSPYGRYVNPRSAAGRRADTYRWPNIERSLYQAL